MGVFVTLIVVITAQCIRILKHNIGYFKYIQICQLYLNRWGGVYDTQVIPMPSKFGGATSQPGSLYSLAGETSSFNTFFPHLVIEQQFFM